ncbi:MAG TPA: SRPBCC domain-containing protein [Pseudolysinimonas sp.]|nr:SRPBCC domain-containing protein [Pseudolysinimonas sp.]
MCFTLESVEGGTELTVVERLFERTSDPAENMRSHAHGWTAELDKLVALLEATA